MVNVVRYWFPACVLSGGKSRVDRGRWRETHSCVYPQRDPRYEHFRLKKGKLKASREKEREVTVTSIQEGEKEKKSQPRNKMPVEFPQEFLLVDGVPAPICYLDSVCLVGLNLFFFFGHVWGERRVRRRGVG